MPLTRCQQYEWERMDVGFIRRSRICPAEEREVVSLHLLSRVDASGVAELFGEPASTAMVAVSVTQAELRRHSRKA